MKMLFINIEWREILIQDYFISNHEFLLILPWTLNKFIWLVNYHENQLFSFHSICEMENELMHEHEIQCLWMISVLHICGKIF